MKYFALAAVCLLACTACQNKNSKTGKDTPAETQAPDTLRFEKEKYFEHVKQLSFSGENAEAYWSFNDEMLSLQITDSENGMPCDQIFVATPGKGNFKTAPPQLISKLGGRTTCSFFLPGDSLVIYASTHGAGKDCPQAPERKKGAYYWPIYDSYDIYVADLNGNVKYALTSEKGYDAEATVSPKGDKIVFTSTRSGDLELYTMNLDGSNVKQITDGLGYDGGAFFSPDGSQIVFRASRPETDEDIKKYKDLLAQGLVEPGEMEIYVCNADGSNLQQVTRLGKANWAPYFHPSGKKIIFSSNHHAGEKGFKFNLFMINLDGTGLEQVSFDETFDSFPMFSHDGKKLVFSSNRFNGGTHSTNVFVTDWKE